MRRLGDRANRQLSGFAIANRIERTSCAPPRAAGHSVVGGRIILTHHSWELASRNVRTPRG
jgi:hypothetical protein